jgi:hypothetical protein
MTTVTIFSTPFRFRAYENSAKEMFPLSAVVAIAVSGDVQDWTCTAVVIVASWTRACNLDQVVCSDADNDNLRTVDACAHGSWCEDFF